uniref:Alternative protein WBP2NL n=1 Tax=Homo sapiens TaxID=9606 RepID=L8E9M8_HUMAN|nr:alternative protein WBP2NL [Homo sapiens]
MFSLTSVREMQPEMRKHFYLQRFTNIKTLDMALSHFKICLRENLHVCTKMHVGRFHYIHCF